MSHLSRHRNKLIAGAVMAAAGGVVSTVNASPLVNIVMTGKDITQNPGAPFTTTINNPQVGDTIVYQVLTFLANTGVGNVNPGNAPVMSVKQNNLDGLNSLSIDAFELSSQAIQVDFKNAINATTSVTSGGSTLTTAPAEGVSLLTGTTGWKTGTGANGGHLQARGNGNNDLIFIRPVQAPGTFRGITSTQLVSAIGTGLFVVTSLGNSSTSTVGLRYAPTSEGGGGGALQYNAGTQTPQWNDVSESGVDPYESFQGLTLIAPEPGSLSLLGLAAAGLLVRRKEKKA